MSARSSRYSCSTCTTSRNVLFCIDCTQLSCAACIDTIPDEYWFCNTCNTEATEKKCGSCGSDSKLLQQDIKQICSTCKSDSLGDPEVLLAQLPSEFFSVASKIKDIYPDLMDIHRKFDFSLTLVRLCRLANLVGFPQIENQLKRCSLGLQNLTRRGIDNVQRIRKEASFDLRNINFFADLELEHYRNANSIVESTEKKINQVTDIMRYWIDQVTLELDQLMRVAEPLRQHYELLTQISRYLPEGVTQVVAVLPPQYMHMQTKKFNNRAECFLIFGEDRFVCLPTSVLDQKKKSKVINGIQFKYEDIITTAATTSLLRGHQLTITTSAGKIRINNSPIIVNGIKEYFDLILSGNEFVVGSPKEILEIETNGPDKNKFKRASQKFIDIINEKLFGSPVQQPNRADMPYVSVTQIQSEYHKLLRKIREIDFLAQNLQIDPQAYQNHRSNFRENLRDIQDSLGNLGGHIVQNSVDDLKLGREALDDLRF